MKKPVAMMLVAATFVVVPFLTWYLTWFGRPLDDAKVAKYLRDSAHPRRQQHALVQLAARMERRDPDVRRLYPDVLSLAGDQHPPIRIMAAWIMGQDNTSDEFRAALAGLLKDSNALVRRNAALSLVRFGDQRAHPEIVAMLGSLELKAPSEGRVAGLVEEGSSVVPGHRVARIEVSGATPVELVASVPGKVHLRTGENALVAAGETVMVLLPEEQHVWEALRALYLIGNQQDAALVGRFTKGDAAVSQRVRSQAELTFRRLSKAPDSGR